MEYLIPKSGHSGIAQWLFHYEKWTIWNCTVGYFIMKIGKTPTMETPTNIGETTDQEDTNIEQEDDQIVLFWINV